MTEIILKPELIKALQKVLVDYESANEDPILAAQYLSAVVGSIVASANLAENQKEEILKQLLDFIKYVYDQQTSTTAQSQSKNKEVSPSQYLSDPYHAGYKQQMDIYVFILKKMGFAVSAKTYFYVCNANKNKENFNAILSFDVTLVEYETNINWIDDKITEMKDILDLDEVPELNLYCENCAYLEQGGRLGNSLPRLI